MMPRIFYSLIYSRLTACSGCPLFDIATNKAMGQYQTSNSRLKRDSRKDEVLSVIRLSSAKEIIAAEPGLVNSKPSVLRTVDKSRPAVRKANRQKKGGVCSHSDFHFDMIYDRRFDMTARKYDLRFDRASAVCCQNADARNF